MQGKTAMIYHYIPMGIAKLQNSVTKCQQGCRLDHSSTAGENVKWYSHSLGSGLAISYKVKHENVWPRNDTFDHLSQRNGNIFIQKPVHECS